MFLDTKYDQCVITFFIYQDHNKDHSERKHVLKKRVRCNNTKSIIISL